MRIDWRGALVWSALATGTATVGCSGAAGGSANGNAEDTGVIVAKLTSIPSDVQCVDIQTSDYRTSDVRQDVMPGGSATIRIAPLDPGYVSIWGTAYDVPCWELPTPGYYYGFDAGSADVTWVADSIFTSVQAGVETSAELHFHQLGEVNLTVDFDNAGYQCGADSDASFVACPYDGGFVDAGPAQATDAATIRCPPSPVCNGACVMGTGNVTTIVDGCPVTQCCVPVENAPDAF